MGRRPYPPEKRVAVEQAILKLGRRPKRVDMLRIAADHDLHDWRTVQRTWFAMLDERRAKSEQTNQQ